MISEKAKELINLYTTGINIRNLLESYIIEKEQKIEQLEEQNKEMLDLCKDLIFEVFDLFSYYPNSFRYKDAKDYLSDELKRLEKITGKPIEEVLKDEKI